MAYFPSISPFKQNQEYLTGAAPTPAQPTPDVLEIGDSGGPPQAPGYAPQNYQAPAPTAPQSAPQAPERKPVAQIRRSGDLNTRLFQPQKDATRQGGQELSEAVELFRSGAGPSRTFAGVGGQATLKDYVEQGTGADTARSLVNAQYTGPQGLDQGTIAGLKNLYADATARQGALRSGGGLQTLIHQSAPGVSLGEARFEAKKKLRDQDYRARAFAPDEELKTLGSRLAGEPEAAQAYAGQRAAEEQAIQDAARGYAGEFKGNISSAIEEQMADAEADRAAAEAAYRGVMNAEAPEVQGLAKWLQSGTAADPGALRGQAAVGALDSPAMQLSREAQAARDAIMNDPRYAAIKDIDPLELMLTKRGSEGYRLGGDYTPTHDGDWLDATDKWKGQAIGAEKANLLRQRQQELQKDFGRGEDARYGAVDPLYGQQFGVGKYQASDVRQYLGFDPGETATRANVSTKTQKEQFNRITDLLGEIERIGDSDPIRAATVFANTEQFLQDEEEQLAARGEKLSKNEKTWKSYVGKARKSYRKAKRREKLAKIANIADIAMVATGTAWMTPDAGLHHAFGPIERKGLLDSFADQYAQTKKNAASGGARLQEALRS